MVLVINPGSDVVVLSPFSCVGSVVQMFAVTIAQDLSSPPEANQPGPLPPHLEDIVGGSHPSLGEEGRAALTNLLYMYQHVLPAPGDPVTGRTQAVRHEIETKRRPTSPVLATSPCTSWTSKGTTVCQEHVGRGAD